MTHKALIKRLQISCLGLDPIDPLRLLVDDVIEALAQPEQEPVAWMCKRDDGHFDVLTDQTCKKCFPVYTTPPQRTWVGLTDEEMTHTNHHMVEGAYQYSFKQGAKWAEAKLKQKNGYAEENT